MVANDGVRRFIETFKHGLPSNRLQIFVIDQKRKRGGCMYTVHHIRKAVCSPEAGKAQAGFPFGVDWRSALRNVRQAPAYDGLLKEIAKEAERAHNTPVAPLSFDLFDLYEKNGSRKEFELVYFDRRSRLAGLVFAILTEEADHYLASLENLIWEICGEYAWSVPAHLPLGGDRRPQDVIDLFAAETGHALAETLYLVGDKLDKRVVDRAKSEIYSRILHPLYNEPALFRWELSTNNWAAVCAGAVGMTALFIEDNRERLAGLISRMLGAMDSYLEGFQGDGGCPEGIGYWLYGFGYYVYFAEMLEQYTGGALKLMDNPKCRRIAEFPLAVSLSDGYYVSYSDTSAKASLHTGLVSSLTRRYGQPVPYMEGITSFFEDTCYRFAHISRNLFWSDEKLLQRPTTEGVWELPDLQWVTSRHCCHSSMIAFSAKGGHNDEPHNQNDLGSFILHAGGESLLTDPGAGVYSRDYFGEKRYTFLHNSSRGHSVPLIDGLEQQAGAAHVAVVRDKQIGPEGICLSLDLSAAYPAGTVDSCIREFKWIYTGGDGTGVLELTDRFSFGSAPGKLEEAFISLAEPKLEPGAVSWQGRTGEVLLRYDEQLFAPSVEVISTQWRRGIPVVIYRLVLAVVRPVEQMEFKGVFEVTVKGEA
ncbi:MAG: hypothetical protein K0R57_2189 [Paenibacillaceae bacterium]|nr:hypothetical protein [Paenibacillaceae bacterium]